MARRVNLVAVQAKPEIKDYRDGRAFQLKMAALTRRAVSAVNSSLPTLVAFPEAIGLYLSFLPFYYDRIKDCESLSAALKKVLPAEAGRLMRLAIKYRTVGVSLFFLNTALEAERIYCETFSSLAREHNIYLVAGTIFLPVIETEAAKGRHIVGAAVQNISYMFAPNGRCLYRTPKINLVRGQETGLLTAGPLAALQPVETTLGRIGTLICFDGFHETLMERYDAMGVQIVIKPSYNTHAWNAPWQFDPGFTEGEAWLRKGLPGMIQERTHIKYGVNPMMVGRMFDMEAEGLSTISINRSLTAGVAETKFIASASDPRGEEIVAATVEL